MTEIEEIIVRFDQVYKTRPSTIRSTVIYGPLGWITRIIGWLFFIIGVGLFIATAMGSYLFSLPDTDNRISDAPEAYQQIVLLLQIIAGGSSLLIGLILIVIGGLCRRIVLRNAYILDLEEVFEIDKSLKNK